MPRIPWPAVFVPGVIAGMVISAQGDAWAREDVLQAVLGVGLAAPVGFVGLDALQRGSTWLARVTKSWTGSGRTERETEIAATVESPVPTSAPDRR